MYFLQQLVNGLCQGCIYSLLAIGYTLIVGVVGLVTFSFGETLMIGAMSVFYLNVALRTNILTGAVVAFVSSAAGGYLIHKVAYSRFMEAPKSISLLCTIGCSMLIKNLAQIFCGVETKMMPAIVKSKNYELFGLRISSIQLIIFGTVILISVALTLLLNRTKLGLRLRAVSQDKTASALVGISVSRDTLIGNCLGTGIGGIAGLLIAIYLNTTSATMGTMIGLKAITCCVLGGLQSIVGAAVGGITIGVVENLGIMFFPATYRDLFTFAFLVLSLMIRPEGLFVRRGRQ